MFILFSSNAERPFQRGILEVLALPEGHPVAFRYQIKYIAPAVSDALKRSAARKLLRDQGCRALIIYAEKPTETCSTYQYCPVRFAEITALRLQGDIVLVEMTLRECADLTTWENTSASRVAFLRFVRSRPGAIVDDTGQGYFLDLTEDCEWNLWSEESTEGQIWQSVVDKLAAMPSMTNCLFYRVRGFFYANKPPLFWRVFPERIIPPKSSPGLLRYPVPMSAPVDLKLFFYRPSSAVPKTIRATFEIEADKEGFSEIPDKRVVLESRYDEISVRLATKRVLDSVLAPVSIRLKDSIPNDVLVSEPLLLCVVRVPRWLRSALILSLLIAPILLALTADDISWLLSLIPAITKVLGITDLGHASIRCAVFAKLLGGLIAATAGYLVFRRLPVSK